MHNLFSNLLHKHNCCNVIVFALAVGVLTQFAGAKHGSPTNDPPESQCLNSGMFGCLNPPPVSNILNSNIQTLSNWTRRGACCDWKRIDFPDTFAFPSGTNLLTSVTLMSYGELRESLRGPVVTSFSQQPATDNQQLSLSLEPDASSVAYGLTESNTFVFVWENACVNRDPTNRVNAAIELYPDGTIETRFGDLVGRVAPRPPEGFIGQGQNADWVTNAFPEAASNILERGYSTWLLEDWTGINEQNGHVMTTVTIASLPSSGPCYLVCGPYKVNATHPGSYSFPLEVLEEYMIRTYPIAVPISISTDDGYRGSEPSMMMAPPRMASAPNGSDNVHWYVPDSRIVLWPTYVEYESAVGTEIRVWKNAGPMVQFYISSFLGMSMAVMRGDSVAEITQAVIDDGITFTLAKNGHYRSETVTIGHPEHECHEHACCIFCCGDYCDCDGTCCQCRCNCWGYADDETSNTNSNTNVTQP